MAARKKTELHPIADRIKQMLQVDYSTMPQEQKDEMLAQISTIMDSIDGKNLVTKPHNIKIDSSNGIAIIDVTEEYDDSDMTSLRTSMNTFAKMFEVASDRGDMETDNLKEILNTNKNVFDIQGAIKKAEANLEVFKNMIAIVKQAAADGCTRIAAVDFNDYDTDI